jgi:hypothetical protein
MSYVDDYFDKIFYINLKRDVERNENVLSQFKEFNITNYERFEAIECTEVPDRTLWRNFLEEDEKYVKGSIGCRDSNLAIIRLAKERNYKRILILEDDIFIVQDPSEIMKMNEGNIDLANMFYFGGSVESNFGGQIVESFAYAVKEVLFDDILNMAIPSGMEIDNFYAKIIQQMSYTGNYRGRYNIALLQPFNSIAVDENFKSNINNVNIPRTTQFFRK